MVSRLNLQRLLQNIIGESNKVYFNPPNGIQLTYPCIIYNLNDIDTKKADNKNYKSDKCYSITLIHENPDNTIVDDLINKLPTKFSRSFINDNLYHYVFTLYDYNFKEENSK